MGALPLIGITAGTDSRREEVYSLRQDYVRSVERAGGLPVVLVPGDPALSSRLLDRLDGLLVTGGADVSPSLYGEAAHATVSGVDAERDQLERLLLDEAFRRDTPVLAICRGMQILNVARGGSLIQDIPSETGSGIPHDGARDRDAIAHGVSIAPETVLAGLLGAGIVPVNSFHHQAVRRLGDGLSISATSPDGIVEALELPAARFVVAVQWHPESFWREFDRFGPLFQGLVRAARP